MKNVLSYTLIVASLSFTACGGTSGKSPVADIEQLRANAKQELNQGNQPAPEIIKYVPQQVAVVQEQTTLNANYFKVDVGDKAMAFYEGQASAYKITLRVQDPDVQMKLTATGLPKGAALNDISTPQTPNTYELRWTPDYATLAIDEQSRQFNAVLSPVLVSAKTPAKANIVKGLSLDKAIIFSLFRTQDKPSEITVDGLPAEVQEGQVVAFSVVARFPGVDSNSPAKPYVGPFRDGITQIPGSNYLEMDGLRYLEVGSTEYLGDFKWKINMTFNTDADHPVQAQKAKDGSIANVNFTQARFALKIYGNFNSTPSMVIRVKINRAQPAAPAAPEASPTPGPTPTPKAKSAPKAAPKKVKGK